MYGEIPRTAGIMPTTPARTDEEGHPHMRNRAGFTLIEVLIVMSIMLILSAVVYPAYRELKVGTEGKTMAVTVRQVREQIRLHASIADGPLSFDGFPEEVDPAWFPGHRLPRDLWTFREFNIQVVAGPKVATAPNNKTFNLKPDGSAAGHTAWYNKANGAFCIKVPNQGSEDHIHDVFDLVNRNAGGFVHNGNGN